MGKYLSLLGGNVQELRSIQLPSQSNGRPVTMWLQQRWWCESSLCSPSATGGPHGGLVPNDQSCLTRDPDKGRKMSTLPMMDESLIAKSPLKISPPRKKVVHAVGLGFSCDEESYLGVWQTSTRYSKRLVRHQIHLLNSKINCMWTKVNGHI